MGSYSNSEKTKESLILAAGQLFVQNGIDSVSVRAIAELARRGIREVSITILVARTAWFWPCCVMS